MKKDEKPKQETPAARPDSVQKSEKHVGKFTGKLAMGTHQEGKHAVLAHRSDLLKSELTRLSTETSRLLTKKGLSDVMHSTVDATPASGSLSKQSTLTQGSARTSGIVCSGTQRTLEKEKTQKSVISKGATRTVKVTRSKENERVTSKETLRTRSRSRESTFKSRSE